MSEPQKPSAADGRRHPDEAAYLRFLARDDQTAAYVKRSANFIRENYPGSAAALIPKMREIYRKKKSGPE